MQNNICIIGVKLNARIFLLSHIFTLRDTCAIFLKTLPDINQALLQFIDIVNLLELLLHTSPYFVGNWVQICDVGW